MRGPTFIIAFYGDGHAFKVHALLQSIDESYPGARVLLCWRDVSHNTIDNIITKMPTVEIHEASDYEGIGAPNVAADGTLVLCSENKLWMWAQMLALAGDSPVAMLDTDTIVYRPFGQHMPHTLDADIVIGYKQHKNEASRFPINAGVLLVRASCDVTAFFVKWLEELVRFMTLSQHETTQLRRRWGGGDQSALGTMVPSISAQTMADGITTHGIKIQGVPCRYINDVACGDVADDACILHFKGQWRLVLPDMGLSNRNLRRKRSHKKYPLMEKNGADRYAIWQGFWHRWDER